MYDFDQLLRDVREDLRRPGVPEMAVAEARLKALRDYAQFALLAELAEEYLLHVPHAPVIMKLYAQAMIDTGRPSAALGFLNAALRETPAEHAEHDELCCLVGRAAKELMQHAVAQGQGALAAHYAQRSFTAYYCCFRAPGAGRPPDHYPGINAAAVLHYAAAEGLELPDAPAAGDVAREVLALLEDRAQEADPWVAATRAEAHVALEDWDAAERALFDYVAHRQLTAFQVLGTLRQFRDLWRIARAGPRGQAALDVLRAVALSRGASTGGDAAVSIRTGQQKVPKEAGRRSAEKILGADGLRTYRWMRTGFERADSVASVLQPPDQRIGTAFVIDPEAFGLAPLGAGAAAMITNHHVLNAAGDNDALMPDDQPTVRFEGQDGDRTFPVTGILFEAPGGREGLDCTIFAIDSGGEALRPVPLNLAGMPNLKRRVHPRVYLIGHARGGELQFSLQDNRLIDHEGEPDGAPPVVARRRLHYFAPTDQGNSGSPVFDEGWCCIGLHRAGQKYDPDEGFFGMEQLNGKPGRHSANEGVWIGSVVEAIRSRTEGDGR